MQEVQFPSIPSQVEQFELQGKQNPELFMKYPEAQVIQFEFNDPFAHFAQETSQISQVLLMSEGPYSDGHCVLQLLL